MASPPRHNKRWTEDEDRTLYSYFQRKGPVWCAERLGRSKNAVVSRFQREITPIEDRANPPNKKLIPAVEAAFMCDMRPADLRAAARRRGQLVSLAYRAYVTQRWAEDFAREFKAQREVRDMGWYDQHTVRHILGLAYRSGSIYNTLQGWQGIGFAFVERVEAKRGTPVGRRRSTGELVHTRYYNPWDVEKLSRDVSRFEPLLTHRQARLLLLMRQGYEPRRIVGGGWAFYAVEMQDRAFGPLPQALVTWLVDRGLIWRRKASDQARRYRTLYGLTPDGHAKAVEIEKDGRVDDLLNGGGEEVLDSAA